MADALTSYSRPELSRRETSTSKSVYSTCRLGTVSGTLARSSKAPDPDPDPDPESDRSSRLVSVRTSSSESDDRSGLLSAKLCDTILAHGLGGTGGGLGPFGRAGKPGRDLNCHIGGDVFRLDPFSDMEEVSDLNEDRALGCGGRGSNAGGDGRKGSTGGAVSCVDDGGISAENSGCSLKTGKAGGGRRVGIAGPLALGVGETCSTAMVRGRGAIGESADESTDALRVRASDPSF